MERINNLDRYQKGLLILLALMLVIFSVQYCVVSSRMGFLYKDCILIPSQENGNTLYSGKIKGQEAVFTVNPGNSLSFRYGEKQYGPYTVTEDPEAVPKEEPMAEHMTGIEIRDGAKILFRGGYYKMGTDSDDFQLFNEEGWYPGINVYATLSDGTVIDGNGNVVDQMEPSIGTILQLVNGPTLTSKGVWTAWILGAGFTIALAVSILFADELFRWNLSFRIRDVERAEPSDWALADRYIGWTIGVIMVLVLYIMGLQ